MDYKRRGRNSHGGGEEKRGASRYRDSSRDAEGNEGNNNDELLVSIDEWMENFGGERGKGE